MSGGRERQLPEITAAAENIQKDPNIEGKFRLFGSARQELVKDDEALLAAGGESRRIRVLNLEQVEGDGEPDVVVFEYLDTE